MKLSVIITTYNAEEWLKKVLLGYLCQTEIDFEIVVADDGSTAKTAEVISRFSSLFKYPIVHVWQKDEGFNKCKILNKAILKSNSNYLLFTDGDCIPRKDFVSTHLKQQEKGYFLSGGYFKLPMNTSLTISETDIENQNCFNTKWLISNGVKNSFKLTKLTKNIRFKFDFNNYFSENAPVQPKQHNIGSQLLRAPVPSEHVHLTHPVGHPKHLTYCAPHQTLNEIEKVEFPSLSGGV